SPSYVIPYCCALKGKIWNAPADDAFVVAVNRLLVSFLLIVVALSLLWKGLYLASAEADVWEHYIPYYREVLSTGSVGPGEVWIHYWASKAAGLVHIAGILSDEFAAQLVSWAFIIATTLIVIDLLGHASRSMQWALFGSIFFLSGV